MKFDKSLLETYHQQILDLGFPEAQWEGLSKFLEILSQKNEELNLVSRQMTMKELIENHVIDCLLPLERFPGEVKICADLGTGGGFPGVIYALAKPEVQFHFYEKSPLKQKYLESLITSLSLSAEVRGEVKSHLNQADLAIARGFKPVDVILQMTSDFLKNQGKYFLLKGRLGKIKEECAAATKKNKSLRVVIDPLKSPVLDVERHLVVVG
ncbi:MAG: 16S rRNA (guanine(527)-N(7))-methyltransferase RsmG [Proteobacteria bacterium]|jgi:16S rRNA (guanine527-N7)-methyltransferase|nr:16S rRNA (guanine(527)-N(7))-methyltransferase RsmG [Pseudomonadota bacterium]